MTALTPEEAMTGLIKVEQRLQALTKRVTLMYRLVDEQAESISALVLLIEKLESRRDSDK